MKDKIIKLSLNFLLFLLFFIGLFSSKQLLFFTLIVLIILGFKEYRNMLSNIEVYPIKFLPEFFSIFVALILCMSRDASIDITFAIPTIIIGAFLTFIIGIIKNKKPYMITTFSTIAGILLTYFGLYIVKLTHLSNNIYPKTILLIFIVTILLSNLISNVINKKFKETKLISAEINENKTIFGGIAHIVTSIISCTVLSFLFARYNIVFGIIFGIIISIFAQFGEFLLSIIRKECEVEEKKTFLSGISSFILSAPALFYYLFIIAYVFQGR